MPDLVAAYEALTDMAASVGLPLKALHDIGYLMRVQMPAAQRLYRLAKARKGGMPDILQWMIDHAGEALTALMGMLADYQITREQWMQRFAELLVRYHLAAMMAGMNSEELSQAAMQAVQRDAAVQLDYLNGFEVQVQSQSEFDAFWNLRAKAYAAGIKVPYWRGATKLLPLPAMPAQGTQCMNNCKCLWRVETLDAEAGDYDAYWERHADDSCSTCIQRAAEWKPVRIRDGMLLL